MRAEPFPQISKTKRLGAGLLAFWLSGLVFLFCCGTINAKSADTEICPLAQKGHCSRSKVNNDKNTLQIQVSPNDEFSVDCCSFLSQLFNKVSKFETTHQLAELPPKFEIERPTLKLINYRSNAVVIYRSPLLNRSSTYLKNRVLRI